MSQPHPHRETRPAVENHIVPTFYSVNRANSHISLPTTQRWHLTFNRINSFKRPEGTLYQFRIDHTVPEEERWLDLLNTEVPAEYAITFRPTKSDRQQWVRVCSFEIAAEGEIIL